MASSSFDLEEILEEIGFKSLCLPVVDLEIDDVLHEEAIEQMASIPGGSAKLLAIQHGLHKVLEHKKQLLDQKLTKLDYLYYDIPNRLPTRTIAVADEIVTAVKTPAVIIENIPKPALENPIQDVSVELHAVNSTLAGNITSIAEKSSSIDLPRCHPAKNSLIDSLSCPETHAKNTTATSTSTKTPEFPIATIPAAIEEIHSREEQNLNNIDLNSALRSIDTEPHDIQWQFGLNEGFGEVDDLVTRFEQARRLLLPDDVAEAETADGPSAAAPQLPAEHVAEPVKPKARATVLRPRVKGRRRPIPKIPPLCEQIPLAINTDTAAWIYTSYEYVPLRFGTLLSRVESVDVAVPDNLVEQNEPRQLPDEITIPSMIPLIENGVDMSQQLNNIVGASGEMTANETPPFELLPIQQEQNLLVLPMLMDISNPQESHGEIVAMTLAEQQPPHPDQSTNGAAVSFDVTPLPPALADDFTNTALQASYEYVWEELNSDAYLKLVSFIVETNDSLTASNVLCCETVYEKVDAFSACVDLHSQMFLKMEKEADDAAFTNVALYKDET